MDNSILLRPLGNSNLFVSPVGLGCWQFSKGKGLVGGYWPVLQDEDIKAIVKTSLDGGINWVDTAEIYGRGQSEQALTKALDSLEADGMETHKLLIATKWWPLLRTAKSITNTIEERITFLGGRQIDLYQIHQPFSLSSIRSEMKAMAGLIQQSKIRYAGVSNYSAQQMSQAYTELKKFGLELVSNQVKYNLLDRKIETNGILAAAKELGISIIAYSPLQQGILTGKYHQDSTQVNKTIGIRRFQRAFKNDALAKSKPLIDLMQTIAIKYNRSLGQIALNWLIHFHGSTVVAIPGASKVKQAAENAGAMQFELTSSELQEINAASLRAGRS